MIDFDAAVLGPAMAVFGEAVFYRPRSGTPQFLISDAVYDAAYTKPELTTEGVEITSAAPVLGVRAAVVQPVQGDRVTIVRTGEVYAVREVRPDGHGHILLILNVADAL